MKASTDFFWVLCGRLVTVLIGVLSFRIGTSILPPKQYGVLSLLVSVQGFCGLILVNPIGQYINRQTHFWWDEGTLLSRFAGYSWYIALVSLLGALITPLSGTSKGVSQNFFLALAVCFMILAATWNSTLVPLLNMLGRRLASVVWSSITTSSGLLFAFLLVRVKPLAVTWFIGQAIGMALGAFGAGRILRKMARDANHKRVNQAIVDLKVIKTYCMPLAVATCFMWLQFSGWRFLMQFYWGLNQLGYVVVGLMLASQLWTLAESLAMQYLFPLFYKRISEGGKIESVTAFSDLLNTLGPTYIVLIGAMFISAAALLRIFASSTYSNTSFFVVFGGIIEFSRVLCNVLGCAAQTTKKMGNITIPYAVGASVLLLLIIMIGEVGGKIEWAVVALAVSALVLLVVMIISMYNQIRFKLDWQRWGVSITVLVIMIALSYVIPAPNTVKNSFEIIIVVSLLTGFILFSLLRKNPALLRLIETKNN